MDCEQPAQPSSLVLPVASEVVKSCRGDITNMNIPSSVEREVDREDLAVQVEL